MATVPIHEQALVQGGNSVFEDVWITDTLHYDFKRSGNVEFNSLSVSGTSSFTGDVTFAGSLFALDLSLSRNANVSGISTVKEIFVDGKLRDGDGNFGTSGQLLSSDGTDLVWINANTTSVANATNVGVNLNSDNSNQFISFFGASSGNRPNRVDADFTYNPSTNTMSGINYSGTSTFNNTRVTGITTTGILEVEGELRDGDGNFGTSGQILSSDGTDTKWINTGSLTAGAASEVGVTAVNTNAAHFITFVGSSSGNENIEVDTNLTYNPSTNILSATVSGSGANLTALNASNLGSGTIPNARFPATLPVSSGANLTNLNASNLSSGTIPDDRFPATLPALDGSNLTNLPTITYNLTIAQTGGNNNNPAIRLNDGSTNDDVTITGGNNVTVTRNSNTQLTIDGPDLGMSHSSKTSSYTLTASDDNRLITTNSNVTVPANVFSVANATTIYNNSTSNITITQGGSVTLRLSGSNITGSRTLAQRGVCTVMCVASNEFIITGSGLA